MAPDDRLILHLIGAADWTSAQQRGVVDAESLATEGFIHCCTPAQLDGVVSRYYAGRGDLVVLSLDADRLGSAVRWEAPAPPDGSAPTAATAADEFPHVYGPITLAAVLSAEPLPHS